MSKTCAIIGCTAKLSKMNSIRLFGFPKNPDMRKKWIDICGDPLLNPNNSKICNLHFEDDDYRLQDRLLDVPEAKRKLIHSAVPKIISRPNSLNDDIIEGSKCDYYNFQTEEFILDSKHNSKTDVIEFIDISRCSSLEDIGNNSNQYIKFYKDSGVQCNLYEELWNERIQNNPSKCNCTDVFIDTLKFPKPTEIKTDNSEEVLDSVENKVNSDKIENSCLVNNEKINIKKKTRNRLKFTNDSMYQCEKCDKKCLNLAAFYAHCNSHLEQSLICSKCGLNLTTHKMAAKHERYCVNKKKLTENDNKNIILRRRKHSVNKTCRICDRTFNKFVTYMDHMNIHNNYKPYICSCLSKFTHYSNFLKHVIKFKCPVKGRIIPKYAPQGQATEMIEMKEKGLLKQTNRFKCRICGVSYARDRYLQHFYENIHLEAEKLWLQKFNINKSFPCSHCNDNVFDKLSDCISHRSKIHRKFPNDDYLKTFEIMSVANNNIIENTEVDTNNINLIRNYKTRPKRINQLSWKEKYCSKCNKYFVKRITFLDHMNIHKKTYPYICSCGVRKRFYQSFLTHIQRNQCNGKPIFPDYAPQTFANCDYSTKEVKIININDNLNNTNIQMLEEEYIVDEK